MKKPEHLKAMGIVDFIAAKANRDHTLKITLRGSQWLYKFNVLKCVECSIIPSVETIRTRKRKRGPFLEQITKKSLELILRFDALPDRSGDYGTMTLLPNARRKLRKSLDQKAKKAAS